MFLGLIVSLFEMNCWSMLGSFWGLQFLLNDIYGSSWNIYTILSVLKREFIPLLRGQRVYRYNNFLDAIIAIPEMSVFRFGGYR